MDSFRLQTLAAILRLSLPPSTATPSSFIKVHMALHASYSSAPSPDSNVMKKVQTKWKVNDYNSSGFQLSMKVPASLAAHIQFALHLTSLRAVTGAHIKLVRASPTDILAPADTSTRPVEGIL